MTVAHALTRLSFGSSIGFSTGKGELKQLAKRSCYRNPHLAAVLYLKPAHGRVRKGRSWSCADWRCHGSGCHAEHAEGTKAESASQVAEISPESYAWRRRRGIENDFGSG